MRAPARPQDEAAELSGLIGDIYDAALDRSLWQSVLEKSCGFVAGQSGALLAQGPTQSQAQFFFEWGTEPQFIESYNRTYGILNPLHVPTMVHANVGDVLIASELIPYDEMVACRFYKEWLTPQGIVDAISVTFEKSAASYAVLAIHRNERFGLFDAEAKCRLGLVAPHYRRAVAIGQLIDLHKYEAAAFADSLDGLAAAMLLVTGSSQIMHMNAAGRAMLSEGNVLRAAGGKFAATDAAADRALHDIFANAEDGDAAVGTQGIAVPLTSRDGERHVAHVLPLTSGARRQAGVAYSAVAAVFVRKAALDLQHPLETIANTFKLTPAEMRVLMMIVQLGGVPEVAPVLGISEATVKTHLQRIFAKTDTSRQADLVKLVAGYMSPLGG
jgi:DNA-binding CsgD family transcriptional regulator